jgi:recombination protein RecR
MSAKLPTALQELIDTFAKLPGIGPKMASRLSFHLIQQSDYEIARFVDAVEGIRHGLQDCERCGNIAEGNLCSVCQDPNRDPGFLCVVEGPLDVIALEKTAAFGGYYLVLGGAISPINGIGPKQLRMELLEKRVAERLATDQGLEIIIATNPSLEGEATASYIQQIFEEKVLQKKLSLSRIARGLPMGSDLEYADPTTLLRALEGRKNV